MQDDQDQEVPRLVVKRYRKAAAETADTSRSVQQRTGPQVWVPSSKTHAGTPTHRRMLAPHRVDGYQGASAIRPSFRPAAVGGLPPPPFDRPYGVPERALPEDGGLSRPVYRGAAYYAKQPPRLLAASGRGSELCG